MDLEKSTGYWVMIFVVTTIVLFFIIYRVSIMFFEAALFQSCLLSVIAAVVLMYLFLLTSSHVFTDEEDEQAFGESTGSSNIGKEEGKISSDENTKKEMDISKKDRAKKLSLLDKIRGKKTCENCGTELIYKEEMDSYYCPQCHDYK